MKTIAIANQKGGVGKTTTTMNMGISLAQSGFRVLMVDFDPQRNLTTYLGCRESEKTQANIASILDKVMNDQEVLPGEGILHHEEGVDFVPSDSSLAVVEVMIGSAMCREVLLRTYLEPYQNKYDYCLIDCNPALGYLTVNALAAADSVLIPVQPHQFALDGMKELMLSIGKAKRKINPKLAVEGIVLTLVDHRTNLAKEVSETLRATYGKQLRIFQAEIPLNVRAAQSCSTGHSLMHYDPHCKAALAYEQLTKEVVAHGIERAAPKRNHTM